MSAAVVVLKAAPVHTRIGKVYLWSQNWPNSGSNDHICTASESLSLYQMFTYVGQVRMTMGKVEERLWSIIRNFADLGRDRPAMLVNAVRIIELQELVDKSLESSTGGEMMAIEGSTACIKASLLTSPSHKNDLSLGHAFSP